MQLPSPDDELTARLRDILDRNDRPRDISQDEAIRELIAAFRASRYARPTALQLAFYTALEGLKTNEEWEAWALQRGWSRA